MAKPIAVVYLPENLSRGGSGLKTGWDMCRDFAEQWKKEMPDYYWFCILDFSGNENIEFKVFHEKDFTEIQYAELKQLIEESIKK